MIKRHVEERPGIAETTRIWAGGEPPPGPPRLVLEVAHGATRTADFHTLAARLAGPFPADLVDFFHVNTDAGAPELALALAEAVVAARPEISAVVLRCRVPRTFVDTNRLVDAAAASAALTPGVPPYVENPADHEVLRALHAEYVALAEALIARACEADGRALLVHSYAPRSVDVEVTPDIAAVLRREYQPENQDRWPLRPEVDFITRDLEGRRLAPGALVDGLLASLAEAGVAAAEGATYPLHPVTQGWRHSARFPGQVLCMEVRRDLLADPWDPFVEQRIGTHKVERLVRALAGPLLTEFDGGAV